MPGSKASIALLGCYLALLFWGSLWPISAELTGSNDKLNHLLGYFGLAMLLGWNQRELKAVRVWALAFGIGALIECLQGLTSWRYFEWLDLLANGLGALLALPILYFARKWLALYYQSPTATKP